jgi:hypothetical protein
VPKPAPKQAAQPQHLRPEYLFLGVRPEDTFDHLHAVLKLAIEFHNLGKAKEQIAYLVAYLEADFRDQAR